MFVSAGLDFKVHSSREEGLENHQVQNQASGSRIISVSICNDNSYIALLRENANPQIFSTKNLKNVRLIHIAKVSNISALTFKHHTKRHIAMGTTAGDVMVYDTKTRNISKIYPKISQTIKALDFTCDDQQLCGYNGTTFFAFPEINQNNRLKRHKQPSECTFLKCHPFIPSRVVLGYRNGHVMLWDAQNDFKIINVQVFTTPISGVSMSSCGNFLIAAGKAVKICGINISKGICSFQHSIAQERLVSSVDLSHDDKFLAVGLTDGTMKLYNIKQRMKQIYCHKLHPSAINIIVFQNGPRETTTKSTFSSVVKYSEPQARAEIRSNVARNSSPRNSRALELRNDSLERMKGRALKLMKHEIDSLEIQLDEHCANFQRFLDNEFVSIAAVIKKWDVFAMGDINQIIMTVSSDDCKSYWE